MRVITMAVILFFIRLFNFKNKSGDKTTPFILKLRLLNDIWDLLSELGDIASVTHASIYRTSKLDSRKSILYYSIPHNTNSDDKDDYYGNMIIKEINLYENDNTVYSLFISMKSDISLYDRATMNIIISKLKYIFWVNKKDLDI